MASCLRCGRHLSNHHSVQCGYGPYCAAKLGIDCGSRGNTRIPRGGGGGSGVGDAARREIEKRVTPSAAINIGINLLAGSVPPVGTLLTAYQLAQRAGEITRVAGKMLSEYEESNSLTQATMAIAPDVADIVLDELKSRFVDCIVPGIDPNSQIVNNILKEFI